MDNHYASVRKVAPTLDIFCPKKNFKSSENDRSVRNKMEIRVFLAKFEILSDWLGNFEKYHENYSSEASGETFFQNKSK